MPLFPKDVHVLIPRTCYVTGEWGIKVADGIKVANQVILKYRRLSWIIHMAQCNHKDPLNVEEGSRRLSVLMMQCEKNSTGQCCL